MKKGIFKTIKAFALGAAALALASCGNLFDDSDSSGNVLASGEKTAVTFNFAAPSRTALPSVTLSSYTYTITATDSNSKTTTLATKQSLTNDTLTASIDAGTYTFTATAYSGDTAVLTGTSSETTISSSNTSVSITLKALAGGSGTVAVTLKIAESLGVGSVKAGLHDSVVSTSSTTDSELPLDITTNSGYTTVTYSNTSVASGTSKFVIFFIYDSSNKLIMPYAESVYVVSGLTSSSEYTINGETFVATVTLQKNGNDWADSGAAVTLVNASNSTDTITLTAASGTATYTGNATAGSTYTVYVNGKATEKTISETSASATVNIVALSLFPENGETAAYADTYLEIEFDSAPTINRASEGTVKIFTSGGTLVDTINPAAETLYGYGSGGNSGRGSINAQYQLIQVVDTNKVRIIPHHNTSTGLTLLSNSTSYYVLVDDGLISGKTGGEDFEGITDSSTWTFTTGAAPAASNNTLTVGTDKEFVTVQGALSYLMANSSTGDWEIKIDSGTYYERLFYSGKANIVLSGQGSATYGSDVVIQWANQDGGKGTTLWNYGSRGRNVFYFAGGDLVIENLSIVNTATRKTNSYGEYDSTSGSDLASNNNQAETLMFDSKGTVAAYNCTFTSKQDTLYLSPSGGKAWFYGCKISGDVDFIWGLSDVALFEKCDIVSLYDSDKSSNHVSYVVASHLATSSAPYGKGFVVYNSTITNQDGETTYLARSPWGTDGNVAQVAIVNTAVTGGLGADSTYWSGNHVGGTDESILGWKSYGITVDGTALTDSTYGMTESMYTAEFAGRRNIINRVYNGSAFEKDSTSNWDVDTLISERGWNVDEDSSKETLSGESETTSVTYDFSTTEPTTISDLTCSNIGWNNSAYASGNSGASIKFAVTDACKVTVYYCYKASGTITAGSQSSTSFSTSSNSTSTIENTEYEVTSAGTVTIAYTGTTYLTKIVVTYTSSSSSSDDDDDDTTNCISLSDTPTGYAGYGYTTSPYYTGSNTITINASDTSAASTLQTYAKKGNYVIYINGMIDMTYSSTYGGSMLPTSWDNDNAALGKFIEAQYSSSTMSSVKSAYTSWSAWRQAYAAACTTSTNYDSKTAASASTIDRYQYQLVTAWKKQIQIVVASNTTIIGLTSESGIKGGTISISGVSNVVLRNLHLQDAFDPFPHHEKNDGWNAEYDCITVQGENSYIWIDHCTFEDTISVGWTNFAGVKTGDSTASVIAYPCNSSGKATTDGYEMWQTYDGLCDIKGKSTNITVSYCVFRNHDKTMLIGSSDSEKLNSVAITADDRTITLHHNYFYGCVQRLPMARLSYIHNYNNYYGVNSSNGYDQKAAVNARYGVYINSEYNYFDSGMKYSYNSSDSTANLYYANDYTASGVKTSLSDLTSSTSAPVFTVPYSYTPDAASTLPSDLETNAGAGVWTVKQ